jgi:cyclopropane fatty-acyl-phospholipid synthase-like methyltransferase
VGLMQRLKGGGAEPAGARPGVAGKQGGKASAAPVGPMPAANAAAAEPPSGPAPPWHALPGEIAEKMWGESDILPADEAVTDMLIKPIYLTKEMSLLDLTAGLGGRLRRTSEEFSIYTTGLELDAAIAARGMELSVVGGKAKHAPITAYTPDTFAIGRRFDCIIARELFYQIADKPKFLVAVVACAKSKARISFTDYILEPGSANRPGIKAWQAFEPNARPLGVAEVVKAWAKVGVDLTVHDDQTALYAKEVVAGFKRLEEFLDSGARPDPETKKGIRRELEIWALRMAALEHGLKFYRFFGIKS